MKKEDIKIKFKVGSLYQYNGDEQTRTVLCVGGLRDGKKRNFVGNFLDLEKLRISNMDLTHLGKRFIELKNDNEED